MKYNFDTILKEFKYEDDEDTEEDDTFETCMVLLVLTAFLCIISML